MSMHLTYNCRDDKAAMEPTRLDVGAVVLNHCFTANKYGEARHNVVIAGPVDQPTRDAAASTLTTAGATDIAWHDDQTAISEDIRL